MAKSKNSVVSIIEGTTEKPYEVVVFDLKSLREVKSFPIDSVDYITDIAISDDGKHLLLSNEEECSVTLVNIEKEKVLWVNASEEFEIPERLLFDKNNNPFILKSGENVIVDRLNLESGECVLRIEEDSWIDSPFFAEDGKFLYVTQKLFISLK